MTASGDVRSRLGHALAERDRISKRFDAVVTRHRGSQAAADIATPATVAEVFLELPFPQTNAPASTETATTALAEAVTRSGLTEFSPSDADDASTRGALILLRGVAGELWVHEALSAGGLPTPRGQPNAELLEFTTPGADLRFSGPSGEVLANVKISRDADVIIDHIAAHPHVPLIYASSDAAEDAGRRGLNVLSGTSTEPFDLHDVTVVDIGRSSLDFDESLSDAWLGSDQATPTDGPVPWFLMAGVLFNAIRRYRQGQGPTSVVRGTVRDVTSGLAGLGVGKAAAGLGASEPISAGTAVLGAALWRAALDVRSEWSDAIVGDALVTSRAEQIAARYRADST